MMGKLLASASWVSVFFLGWLLSFRAIPTHPAIGIFAVFLVVGIATSALIWSDGKEGVKVDVIKTQKLGAGRDK